MYKHRISYIALFFLLLPGIFSGCKSVIEAYHAPDVQVDSLFRGNHIISEDTAKIGSLHWQDLFKDSLLRNLIQEGIDHNLDLKTAYSRINQADAYLMQSKVANYPELNASASVDFAKTVSSGTGNISHVHQYQLGVDASWEADIWGKLKSSKKSEHGGTVAVRGLCAGG